MPFYIDCFSLGQSCFFSIYAFKNLKESVLRASVVLILFVDLQGFIEMIKNPKTLNVGKEAKKHHLIVYGAEQYYQILKQA